MFQVLSRLQMPPTGDQEIRPVVSTEHADCQFEAIQLHPLLEGQAGHVGRLPRQESGHVALHHQPEPRESHLRPRRSVQPLRRDGWRPL